MIQMTCKNIFIISMILFFILFSCIVKAQFTEDDIKIIVTNQNELDYVKSNINNASENIPQILKDKIFGNDGIYDIKIGDYDIGAEVNNGKITEIWPGVPDSSNYVIKSDYESVLQIMNAKDPKEIAYELIIENNDIKIEKIYSDKDSFNKETALEYISSNWKIFVIVVFFIVTALIIFFIFKIGKIKKDTFETVNGKKVENNLKYPKIRKESEKLNEIAIVPEEDKSPVDKLLEELKKNKDENE
jgi:hypothetical protein